MKRSSPKRDYSDYIIDIAESIENIENFIKGFYLESFRKDQKTVFAVVRALEIIGEAAVKMPAFVKNKYKEIPWKDISGMRNKLIHEYFGVNVAVVWKTIEEDLPGLKVKISEILKDLRVKKLI